MKNNGEPTLWNLVPRGNPPSAPAMHSKAKNKPFALLQTLEPPRGPDYFTMERFRQSWLDSPSSGAGGGFNSFSGGGGGGDGGDGRGGGGGSGGGSNGNRSSNTQPFTGERRPPALGLDTPTGGAHAAKGLASFSPAASSSLRTPDARGRPDSQGAPITTPRQQEGFSLFGGRMYSTPVSGTRRPPSEPPTLVARALMRADGGGVGGGGGGVGVGGGSGGGGGGGGGGGDGGSGSGGLSRFKTLAQQTKEREDREERAEQDRRRWGCTNNPAREALTPSGLSPPKMGSPPPMSTPHSGSGGPAGGPYGRTPSTNASPTMYSSAGPLGEAAVPVAASMRKRLRAPSPAVSHAASFAASPAASLPSMSETTQPSPTPRATAVAAADIGRDLRRNPRAVPAVRKARTWGNTDGAGAAKPPQQKSPRLNARGVAGAAETTGGAGAAEKRLSTRGSRSPRPRTKSRSQSPRARAGSSQQYSSQPPPLPRRYALDDFAGADEVCFNPGASLQGLSVFLERCEASGIIALSLLWADLTSTYSAVTIKSCLPSQRCHRWNCACGRQPRARQATAPIIGAVVYLPAAGERPLLRGIATGIEVSGACSQEEEFPGETYLLPLAACHGEDVEASEAGGYQLPIECQVDYDERWGALAKLMALPIRKVVFNAQVALMPLIAWRRRPASRDFAARSATGEGGVGDLPGSYGSQLMNSISGLFDPRVAAWMSNTGSIDKALEFEALCVSWLKEANTGVVVSAPGESRSAIVTAVLHAEGCCKRSLALSAKLSAELDGAKMLAASEEVEMPAIPVLAGMEVSGVVFLPERVTRFSEALERHLEGLKRSAVVAVGGKEFNLASPDQVADILFKHLKLPSPPVKEGSVHASTSAEVLEGLVDKHAAVAPILEFRSVNKYKTTYVDKLAERALGAAAADSAIPVSQAAGASRIHAAWHQTSCRTGRLSCTRPSLQQIPKGSDPLAGVAGVNVRDAFAASRTFTLMAADYSQIEMRVLADACQDPGLTSLFASTEGSNKGDVYRRLAAQVFGKEEGHISTDERTRAKVVCLGILYGMGTPQVARKLEVTESQAQGLVRSFLKAFPGIEQFLASTRRYAREKGYVCTLTGRRRHLPDINNSRSASLKAQAERQAVNSVIQGTAADIMKKAMVLVARRLDAWRASLEDGLDCPRLLMQIHDELVLECPACEEDLDRLKGLLVECMEVEAPAMLGIKCPLSVNMLVGMSWGSMRKVLSDDDNDDSSGSDGGT